MSGWFPPGPDPAHPVDALEGRVGLLRDRPGGEVVGHAVVEITVFWERLGGHLGRRRWGRPRHAVDLHLLIGGVWDSWFLQEPDLSRHVDAWLAGEIPDEPDEPAVLHVEWLDAADFRDVARDVLGIDDPDHLVRALRPVPPTGLRAAIRSAGAARSAGRRRARRAPAS